MGVANARYSKVPNSVQCLLVRLGMGKLSVSSKANTESRLLNYANPGPTSACSVAANP